MSDILRSGGSSKPPTKPEEKPPETKPDKPSDKPKPKPVVVTNPQPKPKPYEPYKRQFAQSGNQTVGRSLKRMKLVFGWISVDFKVNPEDYTHVSPQKVMITQTKGGAWIDAWGEGLQEITIKGTTGVKGFNGKDIEVGYQRWRELRDLFKEVGHKVTDGEEVKDLVKFYNYTDNEYWYCYPGPGGIELYRSKSRPHVYQYTIHLIGLTEMGQPKNGNTKGVIGNPKTPQASPNSSEVISKVTPGVTKKSTGEGHTIEVVTQPQVSSKDKEVLEQQICTNLKELSDICEGKDGKIDIHTAYKVTQPLEISGTGDITNIPAIKVPAPSSMLPDQLFDTNLGTSCGDISKEFNNFNKNYVYAPRSIKLDGSKWKIINYIYEDKPSLEAEFLTLIDKMKKEYTITQAEANNLRIVLLTVSCVYHELSKSKDTITTFSIPDTQMKIFINNCHTLCLYFADNTHPKFLKRIDVIPHLRRMGKTLEEINKEIVPYI